jgi:uncharacterized membrane protein
MNTTMGGVEAALSVSPLIYLLMLGIVLLLLGAIFWIMARRRSAKRGFAALAGVGIVFVVVSVALAIVPVPGING